MQARELIRSWVPRLEAAGIDTARLDAELLVADALGIERSRLFLDDPVIDGAALVQAESTLGRRAAERIPVAQLVGHRWFDGHQLSVTADVLVPRPETEQLVELAAALVPRGAGVIDVGTGSGAIAVSLAARRPDVTVTASDVSEPALAVARGNAERLGHRLAFQHASLLGQWTGQVVVSNPPYVEDAWRAQAEPELAHEPGLALYAGADGLDVIRALVAECAATEAVELVLLEHGHQQGAAIRELLEAAGFVNATTETDLGGRDRITWARRTPAPSGEVWTEQEYAERNIRRLRPRG
ncbi:MAG: peptide chain release factor N(5)-glutamine methyltransferase [Patulibacter minatonensis]